MKKFLVIAAVLLAVIFLLTERTAKSEKVEKIELNLQQNEVAVTFLELSNGEATLIQNAGGHTVLINSGGIKTKKELKHQLDMYGVKKIDLLIITNTDELYTGNADWLISEEVAGRLAGPPSYINSLQTRFNYGENRFDAWEEGDLKELFSGMVVKVLAAGGENDNKEGLILSMRYGKNHFLYMGIDGEEVEDRLMKAGVPLKAEVLKVPDFAESGTTQPFMEEVDPQSAVIFSKKHSEPDRAIVERMYESWIDVYHTRRFGNVSFKCTMDDYEVFTIPVRNAGEK
ncbi:ComEC/Rec2 family competence protein [Bacillus marinisedimentorum]|uniref:ComEC/Rec2 family competence protein n=1 Tax=Bacillus marinisedimentorum TaxID=1821260 RepID=UPI000872D0D6|nr:hypothetical protein [Bacillus marinisedimentorum]